MKKDKIIEFINTINNVDTAGHEPMIQPVFPDESALREDAPAEPNETTRSNIIDQAPIVNKDMYVVPDSLSATDTGETENSQGNNSRNNNSNNNYNYNNDKDSINNSNYSNNTINNKYNKSTGTTSTLNKSSSNYISDTCNSFITNINEDTVNKQTEEIKKQIENGSLSASPLAGKHIAIKDNICTEGIRTTCASGMLRDFIPPYSATVIERLKNAGVIIIGKTNMDEFGMGNTTETSFFGPVKNPYDDKRTAGGSSGGSAAAIAAGIVDIALGSDTGGSIRQPAAHCGIYGLKPTYGAVSRYGLTAYASSLEQIGPMAKNIHDLAALMDIIYGYDPKDSTSVNREYQSFLQSLTNDIKGRRIGIPKGYLSGCDTKIADSIFEAAKALEKQGAKISETEIDNIDYVVPAYYIIACAECSSNLSRFDGVRYGHRSEDYTNLKEMYDRSREEGFGEEVKRRIELGNYVLSHGFYDEYYLRACRIRSMICASYKKLFDDYDLILTPVTPDVAPLLGSITDPVQSYKNDLFTVPANLAGLPSLSIPAGKVDGMPVGAMLTGAHFSEQILLNAAYALTD